MLSPERFKGFNTHPKLEGSHAFLSPSTPHWLRYSEDKLLDRLTTAEAAARGTRLHNWAAEAILLERRQPEDGDILSVYINDALDYGMTPEQMLFYSFHCYGTADTICFNHETSFLRIHDLKTGTTKVSEDQLYVYAGLFCLEYDYKPFEIQGQLRIYQGSDVYEYDIDRNYLASVYDTIIHANDLIDQRRGGLL